MKVSMEAFYETFKNEFIDLFKKDWVQAELFEPMIKEAYERAAESVKREEKLDLENDPYNLDMGNLFMDEKDFYGPDELILD